MLTLLVRYREGDGSVSESTMAGFVPFGDERCSALPIASAYMRPMWYGSILDACDTTTGEVIDVRRLCGAPPPPGPITTHPVRQQRPKGRHSGHSSEAFKGQRGQDYSALLKHYRAEVIWNHFRNRLLGLFNGRCFACDSPSGLRLDHHFPLIRGGRLEPGNIVVLCGRCNTQKADHAPGEFYSADELAHLAPLLDQEAAVLAFQFDGDRWQGDRTGYLLNLGLDPLLLHEMNTNRDHPWHMAPPIGVSISVPIKGPIGRD